MNNSLRPTRLQEIIGNKQIKDVLVIAILSSRKNKKPVPHMLFQGPPGLGKSTFGHAVAYEMQSSCHFINGASVSSPKTLIQQLIKIKPNDVLFIDEIHALPKKIAELLYMPLEDGVLLLQDAGRTTFSSINLQPFTLIGATTHSGLVAKPLVDRIPLKFFMDYYADNEIIEILQDNLGKLGLFADDPSLVNMAKRCKGIPRLANNYSKWLFDFASAYKLNELKESHINKAFTLYDIDEIGLDKNDKIYLECIEKSQEPLGLNALSNLCNIPKETIENQIEPYLLRMGLIKKTKRGRCSTKTFNLDAWLGEI